MESTLVFLGPLAGCWIVELFGALFLAVVDPADAEFPLPLLVSPEVLVVEEDAEGEAVGFAEGEAVGFAEAVGVGAT